MQFYSSQPELPTLPQEAITALRAAAPSLGSGMTAFSERCDDGTLWAGLADPAAEWPDENVVLAFLPVQGGFVRLVDARSGDWQTIGDFRGMGAAISAARRIIQGH